MRAAVWDLVIIVACSLFPALVLRWLGGFGAAGDAIANWGRRSSLRRVRRAGHSARSYARARISS
jgi:hypothetical protein